ncbi:hypothetical protein CPB84DRAFT_1845684 [Gymnopilus junonius]|uniref:DUF1996 domain-containing protein n=1 Tax=Gymnopilus junonius TaxID=109634 RepID=A0A9P5NU05_GYMJU|nr:hypothetical protein CPB84DRAFT_1845684 [Gymnopilus junonius]
MKLLLTLAAAAASAHAYWLMGIEDFITTERIDPVVTPGRVSSHVHSVLGGSNFRFTTNTSSLRESECTSIPIPQDKSAYWFPHLYFQWKNGSFTSLNGGAVMNWRLAGFVAANNLSSSDYLFSDTPGTTTAFPDDFRMLSGDPTLRTYNPNSFAQQAVTFLCLDFNGVSTKFNELPAQSCPSGIRAQINFPSCWDGKNTDSPDHKSHVSFLSTGPDSGSCSDPKFPVVLPRIFMEVYWGSNDFDSVRSQAMNTSQPFVFSYGDATGYGYHADFINGWDSGVLQKAVNECHCNEFGDATCCAQQGIFDLNQGKNCYITKAIDEQTTGTLLKLPGNNPVQPFGHTATIFTDDVTPPLIEPIFAYTGQNPTATGSDVVPAQTVAGGGSTPATTPASKPASSPATTPATTSIAKSASSPATSPATTSHAASTTTAITTHPATSHTIPNGIPSFSIPGLSIPSISIPPISIPSITLLGIPLAHTPGAGGAAAAEATPTVAPAAAPASGSGSGAPAPANAGPAPASQPSILAAAPASAGSSSGSSSSGSSSGGSSSSPSAGSLSDSSSNDDSDSAPKCRQRRSTTLARRGMEKHRRRSAFIHHHDFTN